MVRTRLVSLALLVGTGVAVAQAPDPVVARNELMKTQGAQMYGVINGMLRGNAPFDQARVDAAFAVLERTAREATPLYAVNTGQPAPNSRYRPLPKIWENKADFDARFVELQKVVAEQKTKVKSLEDLRPAFNTVNAVCNGCHELYQTRN